MAIMHVLTNPALNGKRLCQVGKLNTDVCLCGSAHTGGCVVDGLGATAAY